LDPSLFRYVWRHSRAEQLFLLAVILASLPFYWISLEVPKQIVNDAIQGRAFRDGKTVAKLFEWTVNLPDFLGGAHVTIFPGLALEQMPYLLALSLWFLLLVLINGAFKYFINVRKGILGERMLRRMRFDLFALLMRFRPEDVATVKPAEAASMIKDEVEPIGGFIGDAFIQPVFLATQAGTALLFILVQSFWMGLAAFAIVLVQAIVIPILRREQLRLGRERQLASRQLAGRIGDVVESAPAVHSFGASPFVEAEIGDRLGHLYTIRAKLFRRKFAVKFLNNILAQVTPFIFFAVGGYLALKGSLDIGQLVAVIAAYRDLPPPIKDLIDWDQQRQDVTIKYEQVAAQFSPPFLLPQNEPVEASGLPPENAPIEIAGVRVVDSRGSPLLERIFLTIERPSHVALVGEHGSGRDFLARVLGRQTLAYQGEVRIGGMELSDFSEAALSRFLAFVGTDPSLQSGSIRDNLLFSVRRRWPRLESQSVGEDERLRRLEAKRSGNPLVSSRLDWIDYEAMGIAGPEEIDGALLKTLDVSGALNDIYRLGVLGRFGEDQPQEVFDKFVEARHLIRERLEAKRISNLVEPFDPGKYNASASIGENLLFGVAVNKRLAAEGLASDPFMRSILEAEALIEPLIDIGLQLAEMAVDTFADLPPEHPVFERYSAIQPTEIERYKEIVDSVKARGTATGLSASARTKLLAVGLAYIEPRHRLGLIDDLFRGRALRARASFRRYLPLQYADDVEFYDPDRYMKAAPILDNILFGRIGFGFANAQPKVYAIARAVLAELDLERHIYRLGLDFEVGKAGKYLQLHQRVRIALARGLVGWPSILVLENALGSLPEAEGDAVMRRMREALQGKTLIVTLGQEASLDGFDRVVRFDGPRADTRNIVEPALSA
jgi:putative ABC transport system ATP-binding protein